MGHPEDHAGADGGDPGAGEFLEDPEHTEPKEDLFPHCHGDAREEGAAQGGPGDPIEREGGRAGDKHERQDDPEGQRTEQRAPQQSSDPPRSDLDGYPSAFEPQGEEGIDADRPGGQQQHRAESGLRGQHGPDDEGDEEEPPQESWFSRLR